MLADRIHRNDSREIFLVRCLNVLNAFVKAKLTIEKNIKTCGEILVRP